MNKIYEQINERTHGKYAELRFPNVKFEAGTATVTVLYEGKNVKLVNDNYDELLGLIIEICAFNSSVRLNTVEFSPSREKLKSDLRAFIKRFPFASGLEKTAEVGEDAVTLKMHDGMLELARSEFIPQLNEFFANNYISGIKLVIEHAEYARDADPYGSELVPKTTMYEPELSPVAGEITAQSAISVAAIEGDSYNTAVCGVLTMLTDYTSKAGKAYQKFVLYDGERTVQCSYFGAPLPREVNNSSVCVVGNISVAGDRAGEYIMKAFSVASCRSGGAVAISPVAPASAYYAASPLPYEEFVQTSIFEARAGIANLRGSFVAFDFETTGLSVVYDRPTEIGAVKITDGVITETFSTLIDPMRPIPDAVAQKTGITDDMVKGKPTFRDVLPDFYKFSYGCPLIGHNIAFDFPFLLKYGNRFGCPFGEFVTYDTMGMAPRVFPGIEQLSLAKVLEKLGIVNDEAHRALSDATATAKAFIAMRKRLNGV